MALVQLATKIQDCVKEALDTICETRGLKIGRFIEDAILDKIEEMEDSEDLKNLRKEKFRSFSEVIKDLKKHGKL